MTAPGRVILIRHGETTWNAAGRIQGQLPGELNERGRAQAAALGVRLAAEPFAAVYASDLERTQATAQLLLDAESSLEVVTEPGLRERHFGAWQGLTHDQIRAQWPDEHARLRAPDPQFAPPQGEAWQAFCDRAWSTLRRLAAAHPQESILVVSHGGVLRACAHAVLGLPVGSPRSYDISNCAYNALRHYGGSDWCIEIWGDLTHLSSIGVTVL